MQIHKFDFALHEVAPYINWLYFFHAWGFPARLGSIARVHGCEACRQNWLYSFINKEERARAREAMHLYDEAQALLQELDAHFQTHAIVWLGKAHSEGDDIVLDEAITPEGERREVSGFRLPLLRQQTPSEDGTCWCLSDFVHPVEDKIGCFVCSTDRLLEERMAEDEFQHLLHQTLADRLAEATAEKTHERVRRELWGYAPNERLTLDDLFAERYAGKRPAVGYPSLPDQSFNFLLDKLLDFESIGVTLTENGAMRPHASTSGLMLSHPATRHFSVGAIGEDQLEDYGRRRGIEKEGIRKFLSSNTSYS